MVRVDNGEEEEGVAERSGRPLSAGRSTVLFGLRKNGGSEGRNGGLEGELGYHKKEESSYKLPRRN